MIKRRTPKSRSNHHVRSLGTTPVVSANDYRRTVEQFIDSLVEEVSDAEDVNMEQTDDLYPEKPSYLDFQDITYQPPQQYGQQIVESKTKTTMKLFGLKKGTRLSKSQMPCLAVPLNIPMTSKVALESSFEPLQQKRAVPNQFRAIQGRPRHVTESGSRVEINAETRLKKMYTRHQEEEMIQQPVENTTQPQSNIPLPEEQNIAANTVLIHCTIFHNEHSKLKGRRAREVIFTDQHTLKDVSNFIPCVLPMNKKKATEKGSAFFIENCVYTNGYHENDKTIDYIKTRTNKLDTEVQTPIFTSTKEMTECTLGDVDIRLGAQYLYLHENKCFHTIIFNEMRMLHPSDEQKSTLYPLIKFDMAKRIHPCDLCPPKNQSVAEYVTYHDEYVNKTPFYFCTHCFTDFLKNKKNPKKLVLKSKTRIMDPYLHD